MSVWRGGWTALTVVNGKKRGWTHCLSPWEILPWFFSVTAKVTTTASRELLNVWLPRHSIGLSGDYKKLSSATKNDFHVQVISDQRHMSAEACCFLSGVPAHWFKVKFAILYQHKPIVSRDWEQSLALAPERSTTNHVIPVYVWCATCNLVLCRVSGLYISHGDMVKNSSTAAEIHSILNCPPAFTNNWVSLAHFCINNDCGINNLEYFVDWVCGGMSERSERGWEKALSK